jgi:predicted RNase H-like nuclease (RuvC/YqgF family)
MTLLIIGVDPGTTLGYAILNDKGEFITSGSGKEFTMSELINSIISFGRPLVVGCDKNPPPWFAESLAVKLGAKLSFPKQDLLVSEKRELVRNYEVKLNAHEVDALASAVYALEKHRHFFAKIERFIEEKDKKEFEEAVKLIMVRNENLPLEASLAMAEQKDKERIIENPRQIVKETEKSAFSEKMLREMQEKIILLEEENRSLKYLIGEKDGLIKKLSKRVLSSPKEELVDYKEKRIKHYTKQLKENTRLIQHYEKEFRRKDEFLIALKNKVLVKKLNDLSWDEFSSKKFLEIHQGDIIFVNNPGSISQKVVDELKGKVRIIITSNVPKRGDDAFVFLKPEGIITKELGNFAIAEKNALEEALKKRDLLKNIVEEYKKERKKEE